MHTLDEFADAGFITHAQHTAASQYRWLYNAYTSSLPASASITIPWHPGTITEQRHNLSARFRLANAIASQLVSRTVLHGRHSSFNLLPTLRADLDALAAHFWSPADMPWIEDVAPARALAAIELPERNTQAPIARLAARGELDPDHALSGLLLTTATRYYADWYLSGLSGLSAIDYDRTGGGTDANPAYMMPVTERQAQRREAWRMARAALGERYAAVVDPVVLEERYLAQVASEYKNRAVSIAVVKERLNVGLRRLAVHYGLMRGT